ncbi:MAG: hypothetical protein ABTQ26_13720 [Azonexus sp.]
MSLSCSIIFIPSINRASCAAVKTPQGEITKPKHLSAAPLDYCGKVLQQYFKRLIFVAVKNEQLWRLTATRRNPQRRTSFAGRLAVQGAYQGCNYPQSHIPVTQQEQHKLPFAADSP